ncbi:MAG: HAMP domain-containing histidine kinase [Oscillospiraceae bacterium]|jgi:signal transduction histidine kinase|nr:HAMP domain-containing histidine kinase [Oscillospiraceae bacterium]
MRIRNRLLARQISVLLLFLALGFGCAFLVFFLVASPIVGEQRMVRDLGLIAARYFPIAGVLTLVFGSLGVLMLAASSRKRVYAPLAKLKAAAFRIRDGNLDYELAAADQGEFDDLAKAFEEMRIHLKDSTLLAERAEKERISLTANITHDLRTPVTSILGYSEGILDGVAQTPEQVREYAAIIRRKALGLKSLVDDLALLSVLENAPPLQLERVDMAVWLRGYVRAAELEISAAVTCECEEGLYCAADKVKLERVMNNLVGNAVKYAASADRPLELRFELRRDGDAALLSLSDNGPGLPPLEARKVFDRFYRADPSRGVVGGSGLGLSIARQIVLLHKGKIWITNRPGGGLSANVSLPLVG